MKKKLFKAYKNIESEFFDLDDENKIAHVKLIFDSPDDIFDVNCLSKIPIMSDEFDSWLASALDTIPSKYKLDLNVEFNDMHGYSSDDLEEIFKKNILLSMKTMRKSSISRDSIAISLAAAGLLSFTIMMIIQHLWISENAWHEIFFYILDIFTTVLFWEAAGILLVENKERRKQYKNYRDRFYSIKFNIKS